MMEHTQDAIPYLSRGRNGGKTFGRWYDLVVKQYQGVWYPEYRLFDRSTNMFLHSYTFKNAQYWTTNIQNAKTYRNRNEAISEACAIMGVGPGHPVVLIIHNLVGKSDRVERKAEKFMMLFGELYEKAIRKIMPMIWAMVIIFGVIEVIRVAGQFLWGW